MFVIDVSGSMVAAGDVHEGTATRLMSRLDYVKHELAAAIESQLPERAEFGLIAFATGVSPWKEKLVRATSDNKKLAREWIAQLRAHGETNTYGALEAAFAIPGVDTIYLLSDGHPTVGIEKSRDGVLAEARRLYESHRTRVHAIAYLVGKTRERENKAASRAFMKALAEATGGTCRIFE